MSNYLEKKSVDHKVKHIFSGKTHFFEITSKSKEVYNVAIKVGCDCRYMGVQGEANSKMCSHILSALRHIVESKEINHNGI